MVRRLAEAGPSTLPELVEVLRTSRERLREVRNRLEKLGAVVATIVDAEEPGHADFLTAQVRRWDQAFTRRGGGGHDDLLVAAVRSAVVAPERELARWFSWPLEAGLAARLLASGRLRRPQDGWVAAIPDTRSGLRRPEPI